MRPDQHKKKKNSDYKKKHAIPPGRGVNHDKKGSTSKERSDEVHSESKAEHEIDDTVDAQEKKNFSRRKIQSNWDRYKDDEFEGEALANSTSRTLSNGSVGEDFQSLLDKTSCSSSHFKFKSENEWEDLNSDSPNESGSSVLSINCNALAQSLKSIPIEQRLQIDKKYSAQKEHSGFPPPQVISEILNYHASDATIANVETTGIVKQNPSPSLPQTNKLTTVKGSDKCSAIHKLSDEKEGHCSTEFQHKSEKMQQKISRRKSIGDDNLDTLLETDNKESNSTNAENQSGIKVTQAAMKSNVTTAQKATSDTKENLEDWLDSILD